MDTVVKYDRVTALVVMEENQKNDRNFVLESYQDMLVDAKPLLLNMRF